VSPMFCFTLCMLTGKGKTGKKAFGKKDTPEEAVGKPRRLSPSLLEGLRFCRVERI